MIESLHSPKFDVLMSRMTVLASLLFKTLSGQRETNEIPVRNRVRGLTTDEDPLH